MNMLLLTALTFLFGTVFSTHSSPIRPSVVENGSDVVVHPLPFQANGQDVFQSLNVAITPDGSVYFPDKSLNAVDRIDQNGTFSQLPAAHASNGSIFYLHGALWIPAYPTGVVKINTDGSGHRWYPFTAQQFTVASMGVAALPNATYLAGYSKTSTGAIERIDAHGSVQTTNIPYFIDALTAGADGNLYFAYGGGNSTVGGIGRLSPGGMITYFPAANGPWQLVYSNGYIYFLQWYFKVVGFNNESFVDFSKMNATTGVVTEIGLPDNLVNARPGQLSVDDGGNIWLGIDTDPYRNTFNLFQYDSYNGRFTGPIEPGIFRLQSGGVNVGPDDNVYGGVYTMSNTDALAINVRHIQTLEPAALAITAASPATFSISETHYNGPWTPVSLSPSVAVVSPAASTTGTFLVTEASHGTARILVKDRLGNVSYETVNAQ